jgi:FG-GAP-like repeat/RTX calcium-binding nonapeptide repeat (4 copies)
MALGFNIINQKINLTGFQQKDQTDIRAAIKLAYEHSKIARDMFDDWINKHIGQTIGISYVKNQAGYRNSTKQIEIDPLYIKELNYISNIGVSVSESLSGALMHEFGHALNNLKDPEPISEALIDYKGTNLPFVNKIWKQLGLPPMLSYLGSGISKLNKVGYQKLGYSYTNSLPIDAAVNVEYVLKNQTVEGGLNWNSSALSIGKPFSKDLLIGGSTDNYLQSGDGNDFLFGGEGNDILDGGDGQNDTAVYFGKRDDYTILQNTKFNPLILGYQWDGTWTVSHGLGFADYGIDQLLNIEFAQFDNPANPDQKQLFKLTENGVIPVKNYVTMLPEISFIQLPTNDFNSDGNSDILWRNIDGSIAIWSLDGTIATSKSVGSLTSDWKIAGTGDFNGDLSDDILWRNDDGRVATWQLNDSTKTTSTVLGTVSADWKIAGTGDFNGDSESDILWRNNDGTVALWTINDSAYTAGVSFGIVSTDWKIAGTGDFNDDGESDILWRNEDGRVALWQINNSAYTTGSIIETVTLDWKIAGTGDFNGDGNADILWRNDNGTAALWQMDSFNVTNKAVIGTASTDWKIAETGDFNGDGKSDILWRNDLGSIATWQMDGSYVVSDSLTSIPTLDLAWNIAAPILYA